MNGAALERPDGSAREERLSPMRTKSLRVVRAGLIATLAAASLAACSGGGGGGGGGVPPPSPILPPTPPPAPPPPPPSPPLQPPSFYETPEYFGSSFTSGNRSGLGQIGASSAYARGATGEGILVAVIDTGVDMSISELSGQITENHDVATGRAAGDIDTAGHGTMVTSVIVANKDGRGVHGVAYESKVLSIRADRPGSCAETGEDEGCRFPDSSLVTAINYAISRGARIINMSLGGTVTANQTLENAIRNAAAQGVLVVIAAGNEAEAATGTEPAKGASPEEPAYIAGQAQSLGRVVAVGAVDRAGQIASFSNRAGQTQNFYLLAPGVSVVVAGLDDDVRRPDLPTCSAGVTSNCNDADTEGNYWSASGTSFAAPHVAGALALMLDLFPNITPEDALSALLVSATDYVSTTLDPIRNEVAGPGVDPVGGRGLLNLERAFAPIGATSMSLGGQSVPLALALAPASGATGDWASNSGAFDGLVFQDVFKRGYRIGEARTGASRAPFADLGMRADYARGQARAFSLGPAELSWFSPPKPAYDPRRPWAEAPDPTFTVRYNFSGADVAAGRGGEAPRFTPGMMLVQDRSGGPVLGGSDGWVSASRDVGALTFDMRAASGETRNSASAGVGRRGEDWAMRLGVASMKDDETALGGGLQSRFGGEDSTRLMATSIDAYRDFGRWRLSGVVEAASVRLPGLETANVDIDGLWTSAWSLSAEHPLGDGLLRLSAGQPRRAEGGEIAFDAPVEVLRSGALRFESRRAGLTPSGRELDIEAAWTTRLARSLTFETAAALMLQPNHIADADPAAAVWASLRYGW